MLAFDVINLEQHRALQQNAERVCLRHARGSELPLTARSSSSRKLLKLNRQIPKLERHVTCRKQTTETCSNRQKFQKRSRPFPKSTSSSSPRDLDTPATRKMEPQTTSNRPASHLLGGPARQLFGGLAPSAFREGSIPQKCISNRFWGKNRSDRKQTTKPLLTGSRFVCLENAPDGSFSMSAPGFLPSSDHMRTYGRS